MRVLKRDGTFEPVSFDKVLRRITILSKGLDGVEADEVAQKICSRIYDGVKTTELDELTATTCSTMCTVHPNYGVLASRVIISNLHKTTPNTFSEAIEILYNLTDSNGEPMHLVSDEVYALVRAHKETINNFIKMDRDYLFDYFGYKTLERAYLLRVDNKVIERPQYMWMRVALGIHGSNLSDVFAMYESTSTREYTHATPTLFNAGTPHSQMSSCFLLEVKDDSVEGMYDSAKDCALISKYAGGIGMNVQKIRSRGSTIRGTNGKSTGLIPFLRVMNQTLLHINQAGKRNGSAAIYLDPSHPDVFDFVSLRRNAGAEEERCRDLFLALWIPDIFMKRVEANADWSLFCPFDTPNLENLYGDAYEAEYLRYESIGKAKRVVKAKALWLEILRSQIETGGPYMLYKDRCQRSNQSNLGVIKCSNLCSEILIYSSPTEYGVCNLASVVLPTYVETDDEGKTFFNMERFHKVVKQVTYNMDKVIDRNFYPTPETRNSNMLHRPIGIGIQGLADVYMMLRLPFESAEAAEINRDISETMYHAALEASMEIAKKRSENIEAFDRIPAEIAMTSHFGAYSSFPTSPAAKGILQFDMHEGMQKPRLYDFDALKAEIKTYGLRHSLLIALMPTATTSQIMGYTESFEALTSNIYQRRTLAGEFTVINKYLINDLLSLNLWNPKMKERIIAGEGSIQHIVEIPEEIRKLYKTVWEIKQKKLIEQSADRTAFVCHTQSLNLYLEEPDYTILTNVHFYAWSKGLKTGLYYLRTRPKVKGIAFAVNQETAKSVQEAILACSRENAEGCLMCGS
jgi:ribonucleoside-diphosphate reductase alpha subunit